MGKLERQYHPVVFQSVVNGFFSLVAGSLEAAYSLNWGAQEIWEKGGGETLALL